MIKALDHNAWFWKMNKMGQGHSHKKRYCSRPKHYMDKRSGHYYFFSGKSHFRGYQVNHHPHILFRTNPIFPSLVSACLWDAYFTSSWQLQPLKRVKRPLQQSLCQNTQWEYQCAAWADFFLALKWTPNCSLKEGNTGHLNAKRACTRTPNTVTFSTSRFLRLLEVKDMIELRIAAGRNGWQRWPPRGKNTCAIILFPEHWFEVRDMVERKICSGIFSPASSDVNPT